MTRTRINKFETQTYETPGEVLTMVPIYVEKQRQKLKTSENPRGLRRMQADRVENAIRRAVRVYNDAAKYTFRPVITEVDAPAIDRRRMGVRVSLENLFLSSCGVKDKN
jgi:hypothetical protein